MNKSSIEWCDYTWNPVSGCSHVSEGCRNCYAESWAHRFWGERKFSDVICHEDRLDQPLRVKKRARVFVNSMSDLFHEKVPFDFIDKVLAVIALCPQHTFIVLTKRPERMDYYFNTYMKGAEGDTLCDAAHDMGLNEEVACAVSNYINGWSRLFFAPLDNNPLDGTVKRWPLPNLWLGVSVEDQKTADQRIPSLLKCDAAIHFVSYEPALAAVDFKKHLSDWYGDGEGGIIPFRSKGINWIIAGGESGPKARPSHPDWFREARDQCIEAGVHFFFKQWGEWGPYDRSKSDGSVLHQPFSTDEPIQKFGKKRAGRLLDGKEWNQFPEGTL